jgi:hypothetical protein
MNYKPKNKYYVGKSKKDKILENIKNENDPNVLKDIISIYRGVYKKKTGRDIEDEIKGIASEIKEKKNQKNNNKICSSFNKILKIYGLS